MSTQLQYGMEGERPYGLYYQHSGRTPIGSVIIAGVAGVLAAILAGVIYAYAVYYIPFIKLRFLMTIVFGAAVGAVAGQIAKSGKVRSLAVGLAIVGVATLIGFYACWVVWLKIVFDSANDSSLQVSYSDLILNPATLWNVIVGINKYGIWTMSKSDKETVKGTFLALIWLAEGASIFGCSLLVAASLLKGEMFCERCNRWCGKAASLRKLVIGDPIRLRQSLEAHDFSYLDSLEPTGGDRFWQVSHDYCNSCNQLHALTVKQSIISRNKKGAVTGQKHSTLINRLLLDEAEAQALRKGPPPPATPNNTPIAPDASA